MSMSAESSWRSTQRLFGVGSQFQKAPTCTTSRPTDRSRLSSSPRRGADPVVCSACHGAALSSDSQGGRRVADHATPKKGGRLNACGLLGLPLLPEAQSAGDRLDVMIAATKPDRPSRWSHRASMSASHRALRQLLHDPARAGTGLLWRHLIDAVGRKPITTDRNRRPVPRRWAADLPTSGSSRRHPLCRGLPYAGRSYRQASTCFPIRRCCPEGGIRTGPCWPKEPTLQWRPADPKTGGRPRTCSRRQLHDRPTPGHIAGHESLMVPPAQDRWCILSAMRPLQGQLE